MKKSKLFDNKIFLCLLSFLTAAAAGIFVAAIKGIYPFGAISLLDSDLGAEYLPFLAEFWDKVRSGGSLVFSWSTALGGNWFGTFMYYCASPLNLTALLFPRNSLPLILTVLTLFKQCLAAFTFTYFIQSRKTACRLAPVFGLLYAFCGWSIAYYINVIWLDALYMLPLIALGIEKLTESNKTALYMVSLSVAIFSNFYMGLFLSIFSVIYFLYYFLTNFYQNSKKQKQMKKDFFPPLRRFIFSSLFSGLFLSFCLVPLCICILNGGKEQYASSCASYFLNIFSQLKAVLPGARMNGVDFSDYPNVYSGFLSILLLPFVFFGKQFSKKQKIVKGSVLVLFVFSFNLPFLDYIWHGFRYVNGFPFRESFLFSFFVILFASEVFAKIKLPTRKILLDTVIYLLCFGDIVFTLYNNTDGSNIAPEEFGSAYESVNRLFEKTDDGFFRTEYAVDWNINDGCFFGYNGITNSNSAQSYDTLVLLNKTGLNTNESNYVFYDRQTPVFNSIFGIKYIVEDDVSDYETAVGGFTRVAADGDTTLYENSYALPLGFTADEKIISMLPTDDAVAVQSELFSCAGGDGSVFIPQDADTQYYSSDYSSVETSENGYYYEASEGNNWMPVPVCTVEFHIASNGPFYVFAKTYSEDYPYIYSWCELPDGSSVPVMSSADTYLSYIYNAKAGDTVYLSFSAKDGSSGRVVVRGFSTNEAVFEQMYENICSEGLFDPEIFDDNHIKGSIDVKSDKRILLTTVPYDSGWKISVDGRELRKDEILKICNALTGFCLEKGHHEIEFRYTLPGIYAGAVISVFAVALYVLIRKSKRNLI